MSDPVRWWSQNCPRRSEPLLRDWRRAVNLWKEGGVLTSSMSVAGKRNWSTRAASEEEEEVWVEPDAVDAVVSLSEAVDA